MRRLLRRLIIWPRLCVSSLFSVFLYLEKPKPAETRNSRAPRVRNGSGEPHTDCEAKGVRQSQQHSGKTVRLAPLPNLPGGRFPPGWVRPSAALARCADEGCATRYRRASEHTAAFPAGELRAPTGRYPVGAARDLLRGASCMVLKVHISNVALKEGKENHLSYFYMSHWRDGIQNISTF